MCPPRFCSKQSSTLSILRKMPRFSYGKVPLKRRAPTPKFEMLPTSLFVPTFNATSDDMVSLINHACNYSIISSWHFRMSISRKNDTKKAVYRKSGIFNSKLQPIPTGPILSLPHPRLPDKKCSQVRHQLLNNVFV